MSHYVFKVSNINSFLIQTNYCFCLIAQNPCSCNVCIRIWSACDTFPIVTVLIKRLLLTNISKITSSSVRLVDGTVTSLRFSWYAVCVVLMINATVNNAGVKSTRYKTWGCLD